MNLSGLKSFSLQEVELQDAYFVNALEKEIEYLLSFDIDKLLAGFRETAGVDMRGATRYSGWEDMLIGGHTLGHYMTAVVQAYESANTPKEDKEKLYQILEELLEGLHECQEKANSGFLFGAIIIDKENVEKQFDNVEEGKANIITEAWVPWYTMHKILEGLVAAGHVHPLAVQVGSRLGDWVYERTSRWSDATRETVLSIEYGGMNDVMYDLYLLTNKELHKKSAQTFDQVALFEQVYNAKKGDNVLNNRHANTTIPKFMGALKRFVVTGEEEYLDYAKKFWDFVAEDHSYVTGGNSEWEHFGEDDILDAERTNCNCETCNAYNMLKMTKLLFTITGDVKYADWYENTFLNSIMSSQNPKTGMTTYFQPMASGYFKVYSEPFTKFWCCTGSGMENFTKLGESFYFAKENTLVINQYISSRLEWKEQGVAITQKTNIPLEDTAVFTLENDFSGEIYFRIPEWVAEKESITYNNQDLQDELCRLHRGEISSIICDSKKEKGYIVLSGDFHAGDEISLRLPMKVRAFTLPDSPNTYAFKYGPVVLSALLGTKDMDKTMTGVDVTIPLARYFGEEYLASQSECIHITEGTVSDFMEHIDKHLVRNENADELSFTLKGTDANLTFVTHYRQHEERYGIYFAFYDKETTVQQDNEHLQKMKWLEEHRIDTVQPGYGQYENDSFHNMTETGTGSTGSTAQGTRRHANAGGSFSYTMAINPMGTSLLATFSESDYGKTIRIRIEDEIIYQTFLHKGVDTREKRNDEFFDVTIPIEPSVLEQYQTEGRVTFTIEGIDGAESANLCNFLYTISQ